MNSRASVAAKDNNDLRDFDLLEHAAGFLAAADAYSARGHVAQYYLLTFLIGRGMELAFKAYLIRNGETEKRLRKLSHSLAALLDACNATQFRALAGLTDADERVIRAVDAEYAKKAFEYPERRIMAVHPNPVVRSVAHKVLATVAQSLWGKDRYHERCALPEAFINGLIESPDAKYR